MGPQLSPAAPDPGVFYYVLSPSADRYWLTGTALDRGATEAATMLSDALDGHGPLVYEGTAPEKPKSEEPKPEGSRPGGPKPGDTSPPEKKPELR